MGNLCPAIRDGHFSKTFKLFKSFFTVMELYLQLLYILWTYIHRLYNFSTPHTSMSIFLYSTVLNVQFLYPTHIDVNIFVLHCTECTFLVPHTPRCQYFCTALYWMYIFGTPHTSISIFLYSTVFSVWSLWIISRLIYDAM